VFVGICLVLTRACPGCPSLLVFLTTLCLFSPLNSSALYRPGLSISPPLEADVHNFFSEAMGFLPVDTWQFRPCTSSISSFLIHKIKRQTLLWMAEGTPPPPFFLFPCCLDVSPLLLCHCATELPIPPAKLSLLVTLYEHFVVALSIFLS